MLIVLLVWAWCLLSVPVGCAVGMSVPKGS